MDNELQQLKRQVQELQKWKAEKERQQISFPLDEQSREILRKDLIVVTGEGIFTRADGSAGSYFFEVKHNGKFHLIDIYPPVTRFTSDASANTLIMQNHSWQDNNEVTLYTTDVLPGGLLNGIKYYIVNATTNTVQLSSSQGGSAIDLTSDGTGYMQFF